MNLTFYMKSGNKITADKVTGWDIKYNSTQITSIRLVQKIKGFSKCKNRVLIETIDLKQIECVVEH